jgi:MFS family permease
MRFRLAAGALADPNFRLLFIGQATSAFGDRLLPIALAFAVLDLTGSATDLGIVLAAAAVPMFLLVAVAGVWADRLPRHLVMLVSDVVRLGTQVTAGTLLVTGHAQVWHLVVLQAIYGTANAFFTPAMVGLIPATTSSARLQQANALMSLSRSIVGIVGPAVGGTLVALASPGIALIGDGATFGVSALALALLRIERRPRPEAARSFVNELGQGLAVVHSRTWLSTMIVSFGFFNLTAWPALFVLGPFEAKRALGGAVAWAVILTSGSIGSVAGGLVALRVRVERPLLVSSLVCLPSALPIALIALHAPVAVIAAAMFLMSVGLTFGDALWHTTMQQHVPEGAISRVSAIDWTSTLALAPVGFAVIGLIGGAIGVRQTMLAAAALTAASVLVVSSIPSVRNLRRADEDETLRPAEA